MSHDNPDGLDNPGDLTDTQKQLADEIAAEALNLPDSKQGDFVHSRCGDNKAVYEEVMSLLDYVPKADEKKLLGKTPAIPPMEDDGAETEFKRPEIPGFRIQKELGHGGMGVVYEAFQDSLGRAVALKVLPANLAFSPKAVERFRREARAAAKLHNPHIVPVYDFGEHDGLYFYTMELIEGKSLADKIKEVKKARSTLGQGSDRRSTSSTADPTYIVDVVEQFAALAEALHIAHEGGLLHRDLKPSNIMVGDDGQYRLIDFGLVREQDAGTLTLTGELMGTLAYMAPEQVARQPVDCRTDIYSLGATLYEALTLDPPFQGSSDHELQSKIIFEEPEKPTRRNLRLSRDLETVVLKTLEKNPKRRYTTAKEFAEDLQRFLRYEPIQARPVGAVTRSIRWTRRNPVKFVTTGTALIFILIGTGYLVGQRIVRTRAVNAHIAQAELLLEKDDLVGAMEAIGRAQGLDPSSYDALSTKTRIEEKSIELEKRQGEIALDQARREAMSKADEARQESVNKVRKFEKKKESIQGLRKAIDEKQRTTISIFVPRADRIDLAHLERDLEHTEIESERLLQEAREALERAARLEAPWGGCSPATESAFASFFFDRWKEALAEGNTVREQVLRASVESWDKSGTYEKALLGRGSLAVTVTPAEAEVYLFRYEPYDSIRSEPPVIPRLVPVPTRGVGHVKDGPWVEDFYPGDLCLKILDVKEESPAWKAGLRRGDLVIRLNGAPCGDGVFVKEVEPDSMAACKGIEPLARIDYIDSDKMECLFDWTQAGDGKKWEEGHSHRLVIEGKEIEVQCDGGHGPTAAVLTNILGITPIDSLDLMHGKASHPMTLSCLCQGESITLSILEEEESGLTCEVTAYPLILSPENRIQGSMPFTADPGSYLLFIRSDGFEDQRYPIVVPREEKTTARAKLLEESTSPPGFVYIPPGPFVYGGDPEAFKGEPRQVIDLDGFFIARKEVTNEEWFEFVNDEETLKEIQKNQDDASLRNVFLPRQSGGLLTRKTKNGRFEPSYGTPKTPVLGLSRYEVYRYLDWRNKKARESNEPWDYDLPSEKEWEKAARGVDGRFFPWGNRFDCSLTVMTYHKKTNLHSVPGGFEPRDMSAYGVSDMGGSRTEWMKDELSPGSKMYILRGSAWGFMSGLFSRCANRNPKYSTWHTPDTGFRVLARLRP